MGTYYRYVNLTRQEFVGLSDLRRGGDKENAVLYCAPALAWLLMYPNGDGYRGRWAGGVHRSDDIRLVADNSYDFGEMDEKFLNITPGLLQSMRENVPWIVQDYAPLHDVRLVQRVARDQGYGYELANQLSASCSCGWKVGPIFGDSRETVLELAVADHVNG